MEENWFKIRVEKRKGIGIFQQLINYFFLKKIEFIKLHRYFDFES